MKGDFPLADLPIFLAVARHGSMTRAARALHTVQSNVSARIRRLEEALGATLVVREPRGLRLTADGETLLREARRIEALREKILRHFGVAAEAGPGVFRIGGIETFTHTHMERILASFTRSCPGVDLIVETGSSAMLSQRVLKGELDAAFVSRRTHDPMLSEECILRDELVVLAPRAIGELRDVLLPVYRRLRILAQRANCSFTSRLVDALSAGGVTPPPVRSLGTLDSVLAGARAGNGLAALPLSYLGGHRLPKACHTLRLPTALRQIDIYLIVQRRQLPDRLVESFRQACRFKETPPSRTRL